MAIMVPHEDRYSCRGEMAEVEKNDFNLNISQRSSTATAGDEIDLSANHRELEKIDRAIQSATTKHNTFLEDRVLPPLP